MFNRPEAYTEAGEKAGKAMKHHDQGMVNFQTNWFRQARRLEDTEDKKTAEKLFRAGYISA